MRRRATAPRSERGAIAVLFALMVTLLFGAAAIGVDLGNAMNRKRQAQSQADFAALAGGAFLPGTKNAGDPAVNAVVDYLNENQPPTDGTLRCSDGGPCVTANQLVDGDYTNGEVDFTSGGERMTVTSTRSRIQFGVAAAIGFNSTEVSAAATAGIGSPGRPLPMFLPENCAVGTAQLKDNTNGSGNGNVNLTFDPPSGTGNGLPKIDSADPVDPAGGAPTDINLIGENFSDGVLTADFFHEASNDRAPPNVANDIAATASSDTAATVTLPPGVFNTPGAWQVRLKNARGWSKTFGRIVVGNPAPIPNGCGASATGDFGMLASPRAGVTQLADATALNIAEGLDHVLATWADRSGGAPLPSNTQMDSCRGAAQTPVPGAYLDVPGGVEPDCVEIKTGMNTDTVTDGLIDGGTANGVPYEGRLKTDTLDGCDRHGGSDESTRIGVSGLNDDVLSCFLPNGVSVGDVIGSSVPAAANKKIDPRIFNSPRYSVVPVIHYEFNPQNGFYPIVRWQPIFISDESPASTKGSSYATSLNGVITGSNKVVGLQVLAINPDALPDTAPSDGGTGWVPYLGSGPKLVRLVD